MQIVMGTEQVWTELHAGISAFVRRRVRNPADVEDIVQRVFLQVHRGLDGLRDDDRLQAWIYRAARNAIVDHYRAAAPRREQPSGAASDLEELDATPVVPDDEEPGAIAELARCVQPLLAQLSPQDAQALTLTEIEGVTQGEAARRLQLSTSGMKSRVQRARQRLKLVFEECCRLQFDVRGSVVGYEKRAADACPPRSPCSRCGS
jgi:RNA polymerase sigma-70 factor (ECF subfamily)